MPLHDHFHPPWSEQNPWEGFHSAWVNTIVRQLNGGILPKQFRAIPQVHLGPFVEADVSTWERASDPSQGTPTGDTGNGEGAAVWAPPEAIQTLEVEFPAQDVFEVRVVDASNTTRLVAVIEMVSPGNKDRAEQRRMFATKCAAYLHQRVNLVVVDVVTSRHRNLHHELLDLFSKPHGEEDEDYLYAVSYCNRKANGKWQLDTWPVALHVGAVLPTLPLWLTSNFAVPLDLEMSYEETCQVLRIR